MERKKVALITGGGRGIGRSTALAFASSGYDVAITYNSSGAGAEEAIDQMAAMGSASRMYPVASESLPSIRQAVEELKEDYGRVDVLVNNAGWTVGEPFLEASPEQFDRAFAIDLRAPFFFSQYIARLMIETGGNGVIVNITSNQADEVFSTSSIYGTAKAALNKLTRHMALELAPHGIRVLAVAPGWCDVGWKANPEGRAYIYDRIPLHRYSTPEEMARFILFAAGEDAAYMTGTVLLADGGFSLPTTLHHKEDRV